ncbi:Hypothetical predicted protein [Octopus vulgaris]|uniref:Uncharacterized protein n=1 Tax=Octopus vulgaris TaxID=6645 RepID=A0AA36BGN3_OCTVU|nr:Hypothetical predicted protein [Octopus vulgaris]
MRQSHRNVLRVKIATRLVPNSLLENEQTRSQKINVASTLNTETMDMISAGHQIQRKSQEKDCGLCTSFVDRKKRFNGGQQGWLLEDYEDKKICLCHYDHSGKHDNPLT